MTFSPSLFLFGAYLVNYLSCLYAYKYFGRTNFYHLTLLYFAPVVLFIYIYTYASFYYTLFVILISTHIYYWLCLIFTKFNLYNPRVLYSLGRDPRLILLLLRIYFRIWKILFFFFSIKYFIFAFLCASYYVYPNTLIYLSVTTSFIYY